MLTIRETRPLDMDQSKLFDLTSSAVPRFVRLSVSQKLVHKDGHRRASVASRRVFLTNGLAPASKQAICSHSSHAGNDTVAGDAGNDTFAATGGNDHIMLLGITGSCSTIAARRWPRR
jgi:RTX calcium-binding nonapeptide repeat (4 copies)